MTHFYNMAVRHVPRKGLCFFNFTWASSVSQNREAVWASLSHNKLQRDSIFLLCFTSLDNVLSVFSPFHDCQFALRKKCFSSYENKSKIRWLLGLQQYDNKLVKNLSQYFIRNKHSAQCQLHLLKSSLRSVMQLWHYIYSLQIQRTSLGSQQLSNTKNQRNVQGGNELSTYCTLFQSSNEGREMMQR